MDKDMNKPPAISVVMTAFNATLYIKDAIQSILDQTFSDFEFIIINDGSTDNTLAIAKSFNDSRLRIFSNDKNLGMAANFNKGIALSRGEFIARMDADDISLPVRFEKQITFLRKNREIGIVGSYVKTIGKSGGRTVRYFTRPEEVKASLLFSTSLAHPSVMMRREIFSKFNLNYRAEFNPADDYDLWERASAFTKIANMPNVLLLYRVHEKNITSTKNEERKAGASEVRLRQIKKLGLEPTIEEMTMHNGEHLENISPPIRLNNVEKWLLKIRVANMSAQLYETNAMEAVLASRWYAAAYNERSGALKTWKIFYGSPLNKTEYPTIKNALRQTKFLLTCFAAAVRELTMPNS